MAEEKKVLHVFHSNLQSCQYHFQNGKCAPFVRGAYYTDVKSEIEELTAEIEAGHPHIYINKTAPTILAEDRDPLVALKKKLRDELIAEMAAATNPENDMGNTTPTTNAGLQTSQNLVTAAGSNTGAVLVSAPKNS